MNEIRNAPAHELCKKEDSGISTQFAAPKYARMARYFLAVFPRLFQTAFPKSQHEPGNVRPSQAENKELDRYSPASS
jgi:hypothetical protein